jgi:bacterioferritin-associated ferredoxin
MYVCLCKGITESDLRRAAPAGETTPETLITVLGLEDEDCCGRCMENIEDLAALVSSRCHECPLSTTLSRPA